jgi:hypothetical protein
VFRNKEEKGAKIGHFSCKSANEKRKRQEKFKQENLKT